MLHSHHHLCINTFPCSLNKLLVTTQKPVRKTRPCNCCLKTSSYSLLQLWGFFSFFFKVRQVLPSFSHSENLPLLCTLQIFASVLGGALVISWTLLLAASAPGLLETLGRTAEWQVRPALCNGKLLVLLTLCGLVTSPLFTAPYVYLCGVSV